MTPQKIALLTDSCADLSPQLAAENQVFVVPLRILCKDGEYRDGVDIHPADIAAVFDELNEALDAGAKMIYLIPNFQNPTGLTYTAENREQVREVLAGRNIVVVEDDPYGELRFEGDSLPYIGGTALPHGVIMGSFSKTVTPGFRMGYLLTKDHDLLKALNTAKEAADLHTNVFAQFVVLDYLRHNDLDEHLVKIRELYRTQARAMTDAMAEYARNYGGMTAVEFTGKHYDMGNKLKVVEAQVELALQHPEIGEEFRAYLKEFCKTL